MRGDIPPGAGPACKGSTGDSTIRRRWRAPSIAALAASASLAPFLAHAQERGGNTFGTFEVIQLAVFAGITGYEGHTPILPPSEKTEQTGLAHAVLKEARSRIEALGIDVKKVSGGGSCNYLDCLELGILTELQAGGGAVCDLLYCDIANLRDHGHLPGALVLTQIISMPGDKSRAIGDAGFKATGWHPFGGLPQPRDREDLEVIGLSAEHTKFKVRDASSDVARGDKVVLIPGYTDAMGFLHRKLFGIREDRVAHVWNTVSDTTW